MHVKAWKFKKQILNRIHYYYVGSKQMQWRRTNIAFLHMCAAGTNSGDI
jgi:hypothetical protein